MAQPDSRPAEHAPVRLRETFDAFYVREFPTMVAIAYAVSGSRTAAEDLAQEAMIRAHRRWSTVSGYDKPGAWVRRVTVNLATSAVRRRFVETKAKLQLLGTTRAALPPPDGPDGEVWEAVRRLPGQQRIAVALHYIDDLPVADIAAVLGCSPSTARVHLHRGRRALADALGAAATPRERS